MLQLIENWEKRKIVDSISIENLVDRVRNPSSDFLKVVNEIRSLPRKSKEYEDIKKTLPCFTTAFNFNGYVSNKNIGKSTGYLYIDVDNTTEIKLEHPAVVFYCKSISGKGYSIIVGVNGVTPDNIKNATKFVAQELDIELDEYAISKDRLTILSYDVDAYYNPNHSYIEYSGNEISCTHCNSILYNNIGYEHNGYKIRTDNFSEVVSKIDFKGDLFKKFEGDKLGYVKVPLPFSEVKEGRRNSLMNSICFVLRGLNPTLDKHIMTKYLMSINSAKFSPKLFDEELETIVDSVYQVKEIKLYPNTFRTYIYNPDYDLSVKERRQINIKQTHLSVKNRTISEIETTIDNWDFSVGKITCRKLTEVSGKDKKTIAKYYCKFKEKINKLNLCNSNK